jgi:hypothetical protein
VEPLSTYRLAPSERGGLVIGYRRVRGAGLEDAVAALARAAERARRLRRP